ncbi:MAG: UPF0175 family protein [Deferrisomatales bacterium]
MQVPETSFAALRRDPDEFVREMRIAAAVEWYAEGVVSQGKAAELGGLSRSEFLAELHRRRVPACQATFQEIRDELRGG